MELARKRSKRLPIYLGSVKAKSYECHGGTVGQLNINMNVEVLPSKRSTKLTIMLVLGARCPIFKTKIKKERTLQ